MQHLSALQTDHYQWSMVFSQWRNDRHDREGSMEFYTRKMPAMRRFLVMAGMYRVVELLQHLDFGTSDVKHYLQDHPQLGPLLSKYPGFMSYVRDLSPSKLSAVGLQDGDVFFPNEPVLRISGPVPLLHLLETAICGILNHDVEVASKAARVTLSAQGKELLEFGCRRTDPFAAPYASVASLIAGFTATSNCEAGHYYDAPTVGTMAHALVQSYGVADERKAFKDFLLSFHSGTALLIDTYDIAVGLKNAMEASYETGVPLAAVRVDSGDPVATVPYMRQTLNAGGFANTKIIVTNDMDEYKIAALPASVKAMIDVFGVGTAVSRPSDGGMGFVGKLVEVGYTVHSAQDTVKLSADSAKTTWPGRKNIRRTFGRSSDSLYVMTKDEVVPAGSYSSSYTGSSWRNTVAQGEGAKEYSTELFETYVLASSKRPLNLTDVRKRFRKNMLTLPESLQSLDPWTSETAYPVTFADSLQTRRATCVHDIQKEITKQREKMG